MSRGMSFHGSQTLILKKCLRRSSLASGLTMCKGSVDCLVLLDATSVASVNIEFLSIWS